MKKTTLFLLPALLLAPLPAARAQALPVDSGHAVAAAGFPSAKPSRPGSTVTVAVRVAIQKGWHVNAHTGLPQFFIPAVLSLAPSPSYALAGEPRYPPGEKKALGGSPDPFSVYEGTAVFYADVKLARALKPGRLRLPFQLRVQACDNQVCLAPATVPVTVTLEVAEGSGAVVPVHPELFQGPLASPAGAAPENIIAHSLQTQGWVLTFLLILLGGLALNLTPCVYPMIPLTISYFGNQKDERPLVILGRAAAYVVGISVTYSALGVTAALTGRILGSTLQSPVVLFGISGVLVALSLSMFGLYEIQAPSWLLNKVASGNTQGWIGAFGMGLVFGIVAAPCVDPFSIGLLTFVAAKANPLLGFILFFTLSLGLGFPYLWLGFFSGEIQKLPRSGMWMVWVKKIFGLVLLGMPLYFLNPLLPKDFNRFALPLYLGAAGVLLGWVFSGKGVTAGFKKFQVGFGVLLLVLGLGVFRFWPEPVELPFRPYDRALLSEAQKQGKPVFIDFSAAWCIPCRELDVQTFSDPRVHEALKGWVLLKADLTQYNAGPVEELKKGYHILGVPTLVFLDKGGREAENLRVVGFIPAGDLLAKIAEIQP